MQLGKLDVSRAYQRLSYKTARIWPKQHQRVTARKQNAASRKILLFLIALASIAFGVCSPAFAQFVTLGCQGGQCGGSGGGGGCTTTPTLDESASGTANATMASSLSGDVVVAWVLNSGTTTAVSDNSGHSSGWTLRATASGAGFNISEWWTTTTAVWGSTVVTPAGGSPDATQIASFSGGHTASPFDPNVSLPGIGNASNTVTINTTDAITTVIGGGASGSGGGQGLGYTPIFFANFTTTEYQSFSSPQSGLIVNNIGSGDIGMIGDALRCGP
jgi:hypothetical protein